jgi:hypothetical protein
MGAQMVKVAIKTNDWLEMELTATVLHKHCKRKD